MSDVLTRLTVALADRYRLERELGQGGMATVYLAHDVRHDRRVALKVLRPELAAVIGAERFLQEIKTTANLQHPHILALFDSGQVNGTVFYVMPFVEGESLRERLAREKQLPIETALRITREVASALDYAHRHGVIHRDIKPENILLHDGQALVADFGIALAASSAGATRMTQTGMSLGTPRYMSPEQAMGERQLDARTDVYALGCVVYEMLTGEPPFTGPTAQAIVARVMTDSPRPPSETRHTLSPVVDAAVLTALERLPADRFAGPGEFAAALTAPAGPTGTIPGRVRRATPAAWSRAQALAAALLVLGVGAGAFVVGDRLRDGRGGPPIAFGQSAQVTAAPGLEVQPALSPDGKSVAYASGSLTRMRILVEPVAGGRALAVSDDTSEVESTPSWSPDGTRILYLARGGAFSVPASGGAVRQEVPTPEGGIVSWAGWSPADGSLGYAVGDSLFLRDRKGVTHGLANFLTPTVCAWSPDGARLACTSGNRLYLTVGVTFGNLSPSRIVVCRVRDGALSVATDSTSLNHSPAWTADGKWLLFVSNRHGPRDVYAVPASAIGSRVPTPVRLTVGLGAHSITLAADGRHLAYSTFRAFSNIWAIPIPARGPVPDAGATAVTTGSQSIENHYVTPDGKWLMFDATPGGNSDLFRISLAGGEQERLTTDPSDDFSPALSPDGREVAFHSWRGGKSRDIYILSLDGRPIQRVTDTSLQEFWARWSPDGTALAFAEFSETGAIWIVRRGKDGNWGAPVRRLGQGYRESWSPDGKWIAFVTSLNSGSLGVVPVDSGPARTLVDATVPGALRTAQPCWSSDSRTLFFAGRDATSAGIWSVPLAGGTPRLLIRGNESGRRFYRPSLACDSRRLYSNIQDRQSDVWVLDLLPH